MKFLIIISLLFSVSAQAQKEWRKLYKGKPSFRLIEDPTLQNQVQVVATVQGELDTVKAKIQTQKEKETKLSKSIETLSAKILENTSQIAENETKIKNLEVKIPTLKKEAEDKALMVTSKQAEVLTAQQNADKAKVKLGNISKRYKEAKVACDATPTPECTEKVKNLLVKFEAAQASVKQKEAVLAKKTEAFNKAVVAAAAAKKKYENAVAKVPKLKENNIELGKKNSELITKKNTKDIELSSVKEKIAKLKNKKGKVKQRLTEAKSIQRAIREELITLILKANTRGVRRASRDGNIDGQELAQERGEVFGLRDGREDGLEVGTSEGRAREFAAGSSQGRADGTRTGSADGQKKGTIDGTIAGNQKAATREADAKAYADAQSSDAAARGQAEGKKAGFARAVSTGQSRGTQVGQNQAIDKNESQPLASKVINGPYAGAFSGGVPPFPGQFTGRSYRPNANNIQHRLAKKAFRDGYNYEYRPAAQDVYLNLIENIYHGYYNEAFRSAKAEALGRYYKEDYDQGYNEKYKTFYDQYYNEFYNDYFSSKKEEFDRNPNRSSSEYKSTYSNVYNRNYQSYYGQIKQAAYDKFEVLTFNQNIGAQTEKYRVISYNKTQKVYDTTPVLKFVKISYKDKGVNGVAGNDSVFQPSEKISATIVVKNFGKVSASNVKMQLAGGKVETVSIPAKSNTTVKGAVASQVPNAQGIKTQLTLNGSMKVSGISGVAARHFTGRSTGSVKDTSDKLQIDYPMGVNGFSFISQLEAGGENILKANLTQKGSRGYTGSIVIEVNSNGAQSAEEKNFATLNEVKGRKSIQGASVKIGLSDALQEISVVATVRKNGVILGQSQALANVIHVAYNDKGNLPVVAVDANKDSNDALDLIADLGGLERVSVLDISSVKNKSVLSQAMNGKNIIMMGVYPTLTQIIQKSSKLGAILVNEDASIKSMKKVPSLGLKSYAVKMGSLPLLLSENVSTIVQKVSPSEVVEALKFAKDLKQSNSEILANINNITNIFDAAGKKKLGAIHVLGFLQVKKMSSYYAGLSKSKRKRFLKKQLKSQDVIYLKLKTSSRSKRVQVAFAFDAFSSAKKIIEKSSLSGLVHKDIKKALFGAFLKKAALSYLKDHGKILKSISKSLYENIKKNGPVFAPNLVLL